MFVLKKGFKFTTALVFFFPRNELANLAVGSFSWLGICFLAVCGYFFEPAYAAVALLLFVCMRIHKINIQVYRKRGINGLYAKPYAVISVIAETCYFIAAVCIIYLFVSNVDVVLEVLLVCALMLPFSEFTLWKFIRVYSYFGSVSFFKVYRGDDASIYEPAKTVNVKTGVKVNSSVPEFDRVVNPGKDYFAINENDDLVIVEYGKQKENAIVIPKESVNDIVFTTVAGREFSYSYNSNGWKELAKSL